MSKKLKWRDRIRSNVETGTASFLTSLFRRIGVDKWAAKLLNWSENHRKGMFFITMSFLLFVVFVSFMTRPERPRMAEPKTINISKSQSDTIYPAKERPDISDVLKVMKLKNEVRNLMEKNGGKLTSQDSIRIKEIYNELKQDIK